MKTNYIGQIKTDDPELDLVPLYIASFCKISGLSLLEIAVLSIVSEAKLSASRLVELALSTLSMHNGNWLFGQSHIKIVKKVELQNRTMIEQVLARLIRRGYLHEINRIVAETDAKVKYNLEQAHACSFDNNRIICLTLNGIQLWEHIEGMVIGVSLPQDSYQMSDCRVTIRSEPPLPTAFSCPFAHKDCNLFQRGANFCEGMSCTAELVEDWRPDWWRPPRIGYMYKCVRVVDVAPQDANS